MDPLTVAIVALRSVGTLFRLQGAPHVSKTIDAVFSAYRAGKNVDAYMQEIADKLEAGDALAGWTDLEARINAEVDQFLEDPVEETSESENPGGAGETP